MKKLLLFVLLLPIGLRCSAQKTYHYLESGNEYFNPDGSRMCWADGSKKPGSIYLSPTLLKIDWKRESRQIYAILHTSGYELADEGYFTKSLVLVMPTKRGIKTLHAILLVDSAYRLSDVIIKHGDSVQTWYSVRK